MGVMLSILCPYFLAVFVEEQVIIDKAEAYIRMLLPSVIFGGLVECQNLWLLQMNHCNRPAILSTIIATIHVCLCYFFAVTLEMKVEGIAFAFGLT